MMKKLCLVLGAGGMKGRAHIGVIKRLVQEDIDVHSIIGCSAGALVAAYYAACGMDVKEMTERVSDLSGWQLLSFAIAVRNLGFLSRVAHRFSGRIPEHLEILDKADFQTLYHGVEKMGILAFDLCEMKEIFLHTDSSNYGITLAEAVRSSAAIPILYRARKIQRDGREFLLTDGGISDPLPVKYAFSPFIEADIALAVNICKPYMVWRHLKRVRECFAERVLIVQPKVSHFGTILSSSKKTEHLIVKGSEALIPAKIKELKEKLELK
ncbi:MAG: patatin-like phospholipase family protein [Acidobacteriota bacterium]